MSVANTWIHFITNNLYPTSADAFCSSAGQFNNRLFLFPLLHLGSGALPFSRTEWLELLFFISFFPLISHGNRRKKQTAPSTAKGKRKCDDTNSTYELTRTRKQPKSISVVALGFSPQRVSFLVSFILFVIRGMEESGGYGQAYMVED